MRRLRWTFAIIAITLLVPVALIIRLSLHAIEIERDQEHEAIADRVFAEMQRSLDALLDQEEARAPGEYKAFYVRPGYTRASRSPLADLPYPPYVMGYFELDQNRKFQTPLQSDARNPKIDEKISQLRALIPKTWPQAAPARSDSTTQTAEAPIHAEKGSPSILTLKGRSRRNAKEPDQMLFKGLRQIGKRRSRLKNRASSQLKTQSSNVFGGLSSGAQQFRNEPPRVFESFDATTSTIDINVEPMMGRIVGERSFALYRTVWGSAGSVRQGLVLDMTALGAWLKSETLRDTEFSEILTVATGLDSTVGESLTGGYVFQTRFAEPFGEIRAAVAMPALQSGSLGTIWFLALIVLFTTISGLFFAYRMAAARVAFSERRSNFVSAVTHELKTPLTVIRMYSEMLEGGMLESEEKQLEYYRTIGAESERLGRLISNVLELSKVERGTREMNLVTGDVRPVLADALSILGPHAENMGFALEFNVPADLPAVRYDRDALVQIVFNLVDNALKYASEASKKIVILEARPSRRDSHAIEISVRDYGPGVPAAMQKRIFEPFYRPDSELTRTSKGTGIGLALVKNFAEAMGGAVGPQNPPGGGFAVTVELVGA